MSPKKGPGHSGSGGRELQALLDAAVVQIEDKDDAAGQIPWRTSRRLQEATLRSLVNEHESENLSHAKEKGSGPEGVCVRPLKRHWSPSSPTTPLDVCQAEDTDDSSPTTPSDVCQGEDADDRQGSGDSSVDEDSSCSTRKGIIICGGNMGFRRRKKKTVHLANPLVCYIEDKIQEKSTSIPVAGKILGHGARIESKGSPSKLNGAARLPPKIPMSCFDLLCSYSKATGWKCYRSCVEGESMCSFHVSSIKATSPPTRNLRR